MDRHTKGFIVASLVYFAAASGLGLWMGMTDAPAWAWFAHVHLNLLGFMAMMIYGVGYFVLPRFNARELRRPSWVPVHFWAASLGLVGMVVTYPQSPSAGFAVSAGLSMASVLPFAANLAATMLLPEKAARAAPPEASPSAPAPAPAIEPGTRVGEILARWPETAELFVESGFGALADPAHRPAIREDQVLGEILAAHPETEAVFRKYYGSGCFGSVPIRVGARSG